MRKKGRIDVRKRDYMIIAGTETKRVSIRLPFGGTYRRKLTINVLLNALVGQNRTAVDIHLVGDAHVVS